MQRWIGAVLIVVLVGSVGLTPALAQSDPTLAYGQHGPYAVGTLDLTLADDTRPLDLTVWYPAANPDDLPEAATYDWYGLTFNGAALPDAAPDANGGPYPLVIFSHGLGGLRLQSLFLTEHLASYGFVVIAPDHPASMLTVQADGGTDYTINGGDLALNYAQRPLDILRVLDYAAALNTGDGPLAGLIDTDRTAVSGHSFGGYTALAAAGARLDFDAFNAWCLDPQATTFDPAADPILGTVEAGPELDDTSCFMRLMGGIIANQREVADTPDGVWPATTDPRIQAVVALAPWNVPVFGLDGLAALDIPALIEVGTGDTTTPPERDAYRAYAHIGSPLKALVAYGGGGHLIFADDNEDSFDAVWMPDAVHPLINHFTTAFLLATLYDDNAAAALLTPEAVAAADLSGIGYAATFGAE